MKVAVIGCGYVGLITGVGLASKGHKVIAIDVDLPRVERINKGIVPFHEPGVAKALKVCLRRGNFYASTSMDDVIGSKIVFICVQTPPLPNGAINLKILKAAAEQIAKLFKKNNSSERVVVVKSTVIPGTTDNLIGPIFKKNSSKINIVFNPEFLREGSAFDDFTYPDRIVIGTHSAKATELLKQLYLKFKAPIIITTPTTAELSKYTSNTLLATLISFSNEIARICEKTPDTDVEDVLSIVHKDRRFSNSKNGKPIGILSYLKAGCGFGGSCFPKDLSALIAYSNSIGQEAQLLKSVEAININQPIRVVNMTADILGRLKNRKVTVLGAAFKGGTDDLRESPGLKIVDVLLKRGSKVTIYDPLVGKSHLKNYINMGCIIAPNLATALEKVDACIIASNATEFNKLSQSKFNHIKIIDGRRILKVKENREGYYSVGLAKKGIYIS